MIKENHVFWRCECYCFRATLNHCHRKQSREKVSNNFSSHLEKILNCVLLNSIWQLADLDRRKRITVWNEVQAALTYPWTPRIRARWLDKAVQMIAPWTQLRRLFSFILLYIPGLATAIIYRALCVRGHHYQLSAELPPAPFSVDTILSNGLVQGETRARPATENSLIPTCHRNR